MQTIEEQLTRAYQQYSSCSDALAKNTFMTSMKEQNEVLYYKVCSALMFGGIQLPDEVQLIHSHLKEMFSIIYTPTEGDAIQNFSRLFRKPEGLFLNIEDQDRIHDNMSQRGTPDDIDYIVVTDGEEVSPAKSKLTLD